MNLGRIDIWAKDPETSRKFYTRYFAGRAKRKSRNQANQPDSYAITFGNGPSLEVKPQNKIANISPKTPIIHPKNRLAFRFENKTQVDDLTQWIIDEGYSLEQSPSASQNGRYVSVVRDPDENIVEIFHRD